MMKKIVLGSLLLIFSASSWAVETRVLSNHDLDETAERAIDVLLNAQLPLVEEHETPRGWEIAFTNPLYGSNIGACAKGSRKDKPLHMRVYEDLNGNVWLAYEEPQAKINEFGVIECGHETANIRRTLEGFASSAVE